MHENIYNFDWTSYFSTTKAWLLNCIPVVYLEYFTLGVKALYNGSWFPNKHMARTFQHIWRLTSAK